MNRQTKAFLQIAAVAVAAAIFIINASCIDLPGWIPWNEQTLTISSEKNLDQLILRDHTVFAYSQGEQVWCSPDDYLIQQMLWCDIDCDTDHELVLLSWKIGRFGSARPFWVHEDEQQWSQHIYIYDWDSTKKRMDPVWMASDIGVDALEMTYDNTYQYLILKETSQTTSTWRWLNWGLEKIDTSVSLVAVGDNLLHLPIYRLCLKRENFDFLYQHMKTIIDSADLAVINQETPLVAEPSLYGDFPSFGTPVQVADAIKNAGFDIVTCATNHALDRSMLGIDTTVSTFQNLGLRVLGIQSSKQPDDDPYQLISCKGVRLALLNYTDSLNGQHIPDNYPYAVHRLADPDKIQRDIEAAKSTADLTIVFVHWGTEYASSIDESQKEWTQFFLNQEVDVVIGTHPHVTQPHEMLTSPSGHQMLVFYSLGNFLSAQDKPDRVLGEVAQITFALGPNGYQIDHYDTIPIITHQEHDYYSVFPIDNYPSMLARRHRLGDILN